jgi:hypothetical protein
MHPWPRDDFGDRSRSTFLTRIWVYRGVGINGTLDRGYLCIPYRPVSHVGGGYVCIRFGKNGYAGYTYPHIMYGYCMQGVLPASSLSGMGRFPHPEGAWIGPSGAFYAVISFLEFPRPPPRYCALKEIIYISNSLCILVA